MKIYFVILIAGALMTACSSAKKADTDSKVVLGPQVQSFLDKTAADSNEKLKVTIRTKEALDDVTYLHKISDTYYTANVTSEQLKELLSDKRIEKISSSTKKPLK